MAKTHGNVSLSWKPKPSLGHWQVKCVLKRNWTGGGTTVGDVKKKRSGHWGGGGGGGGGTHRRGKESSSCSRIWEQKGRNQVTDRWEGARWSINSKGQSERGASAEVPRYRTEVQIWRTQTLLYSSIGGRRATSTVHFRGKWLLSDGWCYWLRCRFRLYKKHETRS